MNEQITDAITHINQGQERRNAYGSLDGYFYQFELTLYHILLDGCEQEAFDGDYAHGDHMGQYKPETIEDYIKVIEHGDRKLIRLGQIKHHNGYSPPANYREPVLYLYNNYLNFIELNNGMDYQARVFYHSTNDLTKTIATILDEALAQNAQMEAAGDTPLRIYTKIIELGTDSAENRANFSVCSSFVKTENRHNLASNIKNKIREYIPESRLSYDILLESAVSKVTLSGRNNLFISKRSIIDFLSDNLEFINKEAYIELINRVIEYLILHRFSRAIKANLQVTTLSEPEKSSIYNKYFEIAKNIYEFITTNFSNTEHYISFLLTVIPKEDQFDFGDDLQIGYEVLLRGEDCIFTFVSKLAKIAYTHWVTTGEKPSVDKWFEISNIKWLFKYPGEERNNGIIIGDLNRLEFDFSIAEIASRYISDPNRPNVWYYMSNCNNGQCISYNDPFEYRVDISKVKEDFSTLNVNNDLFVLECMICLEDCHCDQVNNVYNIFKLGCCNENKRDC